MDASPAPSPTFPSPARRFAEASTALVLVASRSELRAVAAAGLEVELRDIDERELRDVDERELRVAVRQR